MNETVEEHAKNNVRHPWEIYCSYCKDCRLIVRPENCIYSWGGERDYYDWIRFSLKNTNIK